MNYWPRSYALRYSTLERKEPASLMQTLAPLCSLLVGPWAVTSPSAYKNMLCWQFGAVAMARFGFMLKIHILEG